MSGPFAQAHHKTCEALEREEAARREAEAQMGAELSALTARLAAMGGAPSPAAAALSDTREQVRADGYLRAAVIAQLAVALQCSIFERLQYTPRTNTVFDGGMTARSTNMFC